MTTPCAADPERWFSERADDIFEAKRGCAACPQFIACMKLAGDLKPEFGIWAGMTPAERGKGRYSPVGARRAITPHDVAAAKQMFARGFTYTQAARDLGVSYQALLKAKERAA